jgi:protein gp37
VCYITSPIAQNLQAEKAFMATSSIEWTEVTWNPTTGCAKVSPGCKNCYAERLSKRLHAMGVEKYTNGFDLTLHENTLEIPLHWKKPKKIFVNSMSDLFHKEVPTDFIQKVFTVMNRAHWHQYQILTKRAERLLELDPLLEWSSNVWMGVSVESEDFAERIELLRQTHAKIKFLSLEPLLGPLANLNLTGIDWVIVGGESGPKSRPLSPEWVTSIKTQCEEANVAFFFKQWGGVNKKRNGRLLEGRTWDEMPAQVPHSDKVI